MKCDELKEYTNPTYGSTYYDIDEVDAAIAELKDKIKFCSDFELAARKDIEEMRGQHQMLKQFGHYKLSPVPGHMINHEMRQYVSYNVVCMIINHLESETKKLKAKLEDVQASAYAEMVDAGMRERRLRRALWMHRAITAKFNKEACKAMREYNPFIGIEEYKWQEVERKCRAKAEEYK